MTGASQGADTVVLQSRRPLVADSFCADGVARPFVQIACPLGQLQHQQGHPWIHKHDSFMSGF